MDGIKTLTLNFTDYVILGEALLNLWGGGQGVVEMKPYHLSTIEPNNIWVNANDGQFGCESINSIHAFIYENYQGRLEYIDDFTIERTEMEQQPLHRGI